MVPHTELNLKKKILFTPSLIPYFQLAMTCPTQVLWSVTVMMCIPFVNSFILTLSLHIPLAAHNTFRVLLNLKWLSIRLYQLLYFSTLFSLATLSNRFHNVKFGFPFPVLSLNLSTEIFWGELPSPSCTHYEVTSTH